MRCNWDIITLDDVCSITDCQHKTAPTLNTPTNYRMLRTTNIRDGQLRDVDNTKSVSKEIYDQWSVRGYLEAGDVVLTREAPMGEVALLRKNEKYKYFLGQRILQLKAFPNIITPEFLYYSLQTKELQHQIMMNEGTGSVVSNIRIPLLKKMEIFVPPLSEQKNITKILINIDDKILLNKKIIYNLEHISQTLFKRWFIDFEFPNEYDQPYKASGGEMMDSPLGQIPEKWMVGPASHLLDFSPSEKIVKNTISTFVEMKNLNSSAMIYDFIQKPFKSGSKFKNGDTLLARITPCLENGKIGFVDFLNDNEVGFGSTEFITIRTKENIPSSFSYYFASEQNFKNYAIKNMNGSSGRQRVKVDALMNYMIPIPPSELLKKFTDISEPNMKMMTKLKEETLVLRKLRDTLLPKLLSGEIEISESLEV